MSNNVRNEDFDLVARCTQGDTDAFEPLVKKYQRKMVNIAYRIIGTYEDACEVAQDAFVSAYKNLKNFRGDSQFSTWLYSITINLAKNRAHKTRTEMGRQAFSLDETIKTDTGEISVDLPSQDPSALDRLEQNDIQQAVQECINRLDYEFRAVVVLREIQGFAYNEIGDILKIAEGTVKSRLFRARDLLRDCLRKIMGAIS